MFKEMKSRRLALLVAIALGGGGFLSSAQSVSAADVTGNNVTIDGTTPPSDNAVFPDPPHNVIGTAAGYIGEKTDNGNVTNNTLTFNGRPGAYNKALYGGITFGTGNVTGNKVFVNPAASTLTSSVEGGYGGVAEGGGDVEGNRVEFNGDHINGDLIGGMTRTTGTGIVKQNWAVLKGGAINNNSIYGGMAVNGANGDVVGNQAIIEDGNVTGTGAVYGGYTDGSGKVTGNEITIKGGIVETVYGGYTDGTGEVSGNTVNLGDGTTALKSGYAINGTIFGGRSTGSGSVSNNTLNVNANAKAGNIENFSTINFNLNAHMNINNPLLTLTDSGKTKIKSLDQLHVNNAKVGGGTLIENTHGIDVDNSADVGRTADKTETIIKKHTDGDKIIYRTYQFKNVTEKDTDGTATWGGRSVIGNTTTKNKITLTGHHAGQDVYGGWTSGAGSTATGTDAKNHSIDNTITFNGVATTDTVGNMFGGVTVSPGGNATGNRAVLEKGKVTGSLTGGSVGTAGGDATGNFVDINGGNVIGATYGGSVGGSGKAEGNTVTVTNGTVNGDIYGAESTSGSAMGNKVYIKGGSASSSDVYGGKSASGDATGNEVTVTAGSVRNIDGGRTGSGNATGNTVNIGDGTSDYTGSISGKINGGSGMTYGKDYMTGNTLNVYDNATAANINNFAEINFRFNQYVDTTATFLTLNDGGGTTIRSLSDINVHGAHAMKGILLKNTSGVINVLDGNDRFVKTMSDANKEFVFAKATDKITYEGYSFAHQTAPTSAPNGADKYTWGGRSVGGNSTHHNVITVNSGNDHTNVYGGWTSGAGSTATDKDGSYQNEVTLDGTAKTGNLYGGYTDAAAGKVEENTVTVKGGEVTDKIYGGVADKVTGTGHVKKNIVNVSGGTVNTVYGGYTAGTGEVLENEVNVTGGTLNGSIYGGYSTGGAAMHNTVTLGNGTTVNGDVTAGAGTTTNNNTVNLNGATVNGAVKGGTQASGEGNTLNVKGMNTAQSVEGFQTMSFDTTDVAAGSTMLNVTGGTQTKVNWNTLSASGVAIQKVTLLKNTAGHIDLEGYSGSAKSEITGGNTESNIDVVKDSSNNISDITYQGYQFKGARGNATVDGADVYGGRSKAGNTTTDNDVTVASGLHTNAYGGWTSGSGSKAEEKDRKDSVSNKVKIASTVTDITGAVYGGFTDVTGGKATGNEVTVEKAITGAVLGGQSAGDATGNKVVINANSGTVTGGKSTSGEASGNTVTVGRVTVNSITGGDGATTNDNTVNLNGTTVTGTLTGGTAANGTGNTLNVKGKDNKAGAIANIQKMVFDASGLAKNDTMLEVTGTARTDVNWADLKATGTAAKPLTLFKNVNGINLSNYTGAAKSVTTETTETNVDVRKTGGTITEITYEGYQFKGVQTATTDGGNLYGGISKAGNSTRENTITVNSGTHTNVYGGWTSGAGSTAAEKDNSHDNTVTIAGGTVTGKVYGGYTEAADGKTYNNTVNLNGGNLSNAEISGGNRMIGTEKGNTLNVNTAATVKKIDNFQTVTFKDKNAKLTLTGTGVKFNLAAVNAGFDAAAQKQTLVESSNALDLTGDTFRSDLSADGTKETNIEVSADKKQITRYGYTFKNAATATTVGSDTWGGRSAAGNTTTGNVLTLTAGAHTNVYGGWTSGTGSKAADQRGDSTKNSVTVKESATVSGTVYGGYTGVMGGKATGNTVTVEKTLNADIIGGKAVAEASGNTVNVTNATVKSITGGSGTVTNDNRINLRDAKVTGMVTGGTAANGTGNTLNVSYGTKTTEVGDYKGIRNLHFDMEKAPMDGTAHTMLRLTNVGGAKSLSHTHIDLHRDGAAPKLQQGDKITLMENAGADITVGENLTAKGTDGVTRNYEFALATVGKTLIATVTKAGLGEQAKSFVETRAGASAFLNDGGDYLAGSGMEAAKKEAHAAAQAGSGAYGLWAGMGGGALRHKTGSYVDMKGWNLGLGWARENAVQAGTLTFGPFVEYGRGSYDSYLDDGTHGSGKTSFFGAGMMAKLETGSHWIDGSLRIGRTKSDYTGLANYDTSNTYYGVQVGVGKDFHMSETDAVSAYVRYSYTHTAGTSAHLSSGETLDFDAVNSRRLRIGTRYTHGLTTLSQFYAGLAWEHEFDGDARATSQGDSAPSPSLKGSSALLELGYRFAPKADSRVSYDLNLTGWQGKRQGITGGLSVKWAF